MWYAKDANEVTVNTLFKEANKSDLLNGEYKYYQNDDGSVRNITKQDIINPELDLSKVFRTHSASKKSKDPRYTQELNINGDKLSPPSGHEWKADPDGMERLIQMGRLRGNSPSRPYKIFYTDFPYSLLNNLWDDTLAEQNPIYAVQTDELPIERCMLLCSHPGDLVMDITCGSGTTAWVAENLGRRWITCDTSRVSLTLAKQRLMTSEFDYYELAYPNEGISSGFKYKTAKRINLEMLANNTPGVEEIFYDKPKVINDKTRITGPFTVEAVPAPHAKRFDELEQEDSGSDTSISRSGETNRQLEWRDELLRAGVRVKGGNIIQFTRVEPLVGTKYIQAEAETTEDTPKKVLVVFGPEHAPLEQRTVENAWQEARALKPDMLLFCAFQFDEEAAKDIDELTPSIAGMQLLKVQMNADMLTDDLRKKRSSNESFWLIGQPDVQIHKLNDGKIQVEVMGFDYYNPKTGNVESGGKKNIAMWMLDTDYDNRSLFPSQVFFPMSGSKDGWSKLEKNLKSEIDLEKIESFRGTLSLPFESGSVIAVKIIDDRGIESLRVLNV